MGKQKIISGNTVLIPQYDPSSPEEREKYERLKKQRKESKDLHKYRKNKKRAKTILKIALVFSVAVSFLWRYSVLYKMQGQLDNITTHASVIASENENLKVDLLKNSNVEMVESTAVSKLKMIYPDKNHVAKCNLEKNNFSKVTPSKNKFSKNEDFISKIKSMFF